MLARRVPDVGAGPGGDRSLQRCIVGHGVGTQPAADAQKPGAELLVAPQVLGLETRALGGEAVGPTQNGELLTEGPGGPGEPLRRVVCTGIAHKAYLQVQRGQGRRQIRLPRRQAKPAADAPDHPSAKRIVGDEVNPAFELAAGNRFGHVVQQGSEAQSLYTVFPHAGTNPALLKLAFDTPDDLEDVVQGVQMVVRASFQFTGEGELGDTVEEAGSIQWGFEGHAEVQGSSVGGVSSCGSYWGWDDL